MQHIPDGVTESPIPTLGANTYEENAEYWVQIIREHRDRFRTGLTDAAVLDATDSVAGLRNLDTGCGEGYLSRELHARGADVLGVDSSAKLIGAASEFTSPDDPSLAYRVNDVANLDLDEASFDLIVANHLMNDLPDPTKPIHEFARVLRPGGRLVILMLHPCFYGNRPSRADDPSKLASGQYFSHRKISQRFNVDGLISPEEVTSWHRPLEFYAGALRDAGFCLTDLREPHPTLELLRSDAWWQANFTRPLFLLLIARRDATA